MRIRTEYDQWYRGCFSDVQVVDQVNDRSFRTCINSGRYLYRTFDGRYFYYCGGCTYLLLASGDDFQVELDVIDCDSAVTCRKVGMFLIKNTIFSFINILRYDINSKSCRLETRFRV